MKSLDLTKLKSLSELIYKIVKITTVDGKIYEGEFDSYTHGFDSDDGEESIGLSYGGDSICFTKRDIKTIEAEETAADIAVSIENGLLRQ